MEPRFAFRTHYQVDEPVYLGLLIREATSATRSEYAERVAQRFAKAVQRRNIPFNIAAAGYAVDLARRLGLITPQQVWTPLGHLVALFAGDRSDNLALALCLTPAERLLYFRIFLEGDGAALLFLSQYLLDHESLPNESDADWNSVASDMAVWCFSEYLKLTSVMSERVTIRRELDRVRKEPYHGKTGNHKLFIHLQTMYRIGLVDWEDGAARRRYLGIPDTLDLFVAVVGNVLQLEAIIKDHRWADAVKAVTPQTEPLAVQHDWVANALGGYYQRIMGTGIALCPIETLIDAVVLKQLSTGKVVSWTAVRDWLIYEQRGTPRTIRFHVDRTGTPAFVRLDKGLVEAWIS